MNVRSKSLNSNRPIFIIGSPRSGNTLLRVILDSHPHISCGPETHILNDLARIVGAHWPAFQMYQSDKEYWYRKVAEFFESFKTDYARSRDKARWADKTPPYALIGDFINKLFPDCQFIHIIRDGRDVVASYKARWGFHMGMRAINKWQLHVKEGRKLAGLAPDRYHELRYEELVENPEAVMRRVFEYLAEPWVPEVLQYDRFEHDLPGPPMAREASQRITTGDNSLIYKSRVGTGKGELGSILSIGFKFRNGKLLRELGYK
ncbi:MAG: sulfotransferase [Calditrichaeota bacterium]|nr:sulfotransferase [Calditrichota bacterium]